MRIPRGAPTPAGVPRPAEIDERHNRARKPTMVSGPDCVVSAHRDVDIRAGLRQICGLLSRLPILFSRLGFLRSEVWTPGSSSVMAHRFTLVNC